MVSSAFADQTWTIDSKNKQSVPFAYEKVAAKINSTVMAYGKFSNTEMGEVTSWVCKVSKKSPRVIPYLDQCEVKLTLPESWHYYGSFKLNLGFDAFSESVTSLQYEWVKEE